MNRFCNSPLAVTGMRLPPRWIIRKLVRGVTLLAALASFFMITAAPGGGGSGGGGSAGGGGYGGGASYGSGGDSAPMDRGSMLALVAFGGAFCLLAMIGSCSRVVHVVVSLRDGAAPVSELDAVLRDGDFRAPGGRREALRRIARLIDAAEIADATIRVSKRIPSADETAKRRWQEQMQRAGLQQQTGHTAPDLPPGVPRAREGDACIVGMVFTLQDLFSYKPGGAREAAAALAKLAKEPPAPNALYFYYAPDPGERLDATAARQMFQALCSGA